MRGSIFSVIACGLGFVAQSLAAAAPNIPHRPISRDPNRHPGAPQRRTIQPVFTESQLWALTTRLWDNFIYPNDVKQAQAINSTLFASNVQGRVDITRHFDGRELNTEYMFGLFVSQATNPNAVTLLGYPISYTIEQFVGYGNIVSVSANVNFNGTAIGGIILPVWIDLWLTFNSAGQITQYDATFRWFDWLIDTVQGIIQQAIGAPTEDATEAYLSTVFSQSICATHAAYCNGTNSQYSSTSACLSYLENNVRFGKAYELGSNTLSCRAMHEAMIPFRPDVHCPHIGPAGGGMCVDDYTYSSKVNENYFSNNPWIPAGLKK